MTTLDHAHLVVDLCGRYREPARHYHTLEHVAELLAWLEHLRPYAERPALIAWAIWFHDAIYDPSRSDNELQSAALARTQLPAVGVSASDCDQVVEMVLATAAHHDRPAHGDHALFLDLDLSILGAPSSRYDAYTRQVRSEYGFVLDQTFCERRTVFLTRWLARPRLYFTDACHALFEARARVNLTRELAVLGISSVSACAAGPRPGEHEGD